MHVWEGDFVLSQPCCRPDLNPRKASPPPSLPSPSSLARCHLSQSERPWQSVKFPALHFTLCCRKGNFLQDGQAVRSRASPRRQTFRHKKAPTLGELSAKQTERASPAARALGVGLDSLMDGADFRKVRSKLAGSVFVSILALSVTASPCQLPQRGSFWGRGQVRRYFTAPQRSALPPSHTPSPPALCGGAFRGPQRPRSGGAGRTNGPSSG